MANVTAIVLIIVLAFVAFYFFTNYNQRGLTTDLHIQTTTTSQITSSTQTSSTQNINFLRRKYYINISSGKGITWFDNSTVDDVRSGFSAWQNDENNFIQFTEINDSSADISISFTSGLGTNGSTKTIGETFVSEGLIKGTIQIIPQGVPCRNVGIMMHELGHVIGLDHNQTNRFDIMYPLQSFGCDQNISQYDIDQAHQLIEQLIS